MTHVDLPFILRQAIRYAIRQGGSCDPEWVSIAGWAVHQALLAWTPDKQNMTAYIHAVIRNEIARERARKARCVCLPPEVLSAVPCVPRRSVHAAIARLGVWAPLAHAYFTDRQGLNTVCQRFGLSKILGRKALYDIATTLCEELRI